MKNLYTKFNGSFTLATFGCLAVLVLSVTTSSAQTYYSFYNNPAAHSYVINPTLNINCTALPIQNPTAFADSMPETFSYFASLAPSSCSDSVYHFVSNLNIPNNQLLSAGYKAGFRIRIPSGLSLDTLRKYTVISTFLNTGQLVEAAYNNNILGVDSASGGVDWFLYFMTTKPFNTVELNVHPTIVPLNLVDSFRFEVYYAVASMDFVFPATIKDFAVSASGSNAQLSFTSLTETNVAKYTIERSNNGGRTYVAVGSITAKGNGSYVYTDLSLANGSYLYRIMVMDKDGSSKTTNALPVAIKSGGKLIVYPSVVSAGQALNIKTSLTGSLQALLYDATGRVVSQQRLTSSGSFALPTTALTKGVYTVKIIPASGEAQQVRFIVN